MNRKFATILMTGTVALLAAGAAVAQDAGNSGEDRIDIGDRGARMASRGHRQSMRPEHMARMITRRLELDDNQTERVSNIMAGVKPEFDVLRERGTLNHEAMRSLDVDDPDYGAKLQNLSAEQGELAATTAELRGRIRAEIHAILTPEQREKFAATSAREWHRGETQRHRDRSQSEVQ